MFTRFRTVSAVHVFNAPLIKIPPQAAGAPFLSLLGEAYESEEELHRLWLIRNAQDLEATLADPDFPAHPSVSQFLSELDCLLEFLQSVPDETVAVFSSDRRPSDVPRNQSE